MIAASAPIQRPPDAKLLALDSAGHLRHMERARFPELLRPGDLVIANDAATLPASLAGVHTRSGQPVEIRLAGRNSLALDEVSDFSAIVFGAGDFRTKTEDRPLPPELRPGDRLHLGCLIARVVRLLDHPRHVSLHFDGSADEIWEGLSRHGRPIQYSHVTSPLAVWDTWTPIAGPPVAFEPPSAGFVLNWSILSSLARRGVGFATITHAAGISSTGDAQLDARLPFDEPYRIPTSTALAIRRAKVQECRVIAVGTTVVRALEHAALCDGSVASGAGVATQRITPSTHLRVVDSILSGTHERGTSHYDLLSAFTDQAALRSMDEALDSWAYRTHEYGDSVFIERVTRGQAAQEAA